MSRKGNCWDNAPQESFFGHFKDEAHIKQCKNLDELRREVKRYMMYHNTARYQWVPWRLSKIILSPTARVWNLKKMTPVGYRNHLLNVA